MLPNPMGLLLLGSGLLNPITISSAVMTLRRKHGIVRSALAFSVPVCLLCTWAFLGMMGSAIHVGHGLWVVGIVLIVGPEIVMPFNELFQDTIRRR